MSTGLSTNFSIGLVKATLKNKLRQSDLVGTLGALVKIKATKGSSVKYTIVVDNLEFISFDKFILDPISRVVLRHGDCFSTFPILEYAALLATELILEVNLKEAKNKKDGAKQHRINILLKELKSKKVIMESIPLAAALVPTATYYIDSLEQIHMNLPMLKSFEGIQSSTSISNIDLSMILDDEFAAVIEATDVYREYIKDVENSVILPEQLNTQLYTGIARNMIAYRKELIPCIGDLYKYDMYPTVMDIDELNSTDSRIRSNLFRLSKLLSKDQRTISMEVAFNNIIGIIRHNVAKSIISGMLSPVQDIIGFNSYRKNRDLFKFLESIDDEMKITSFVELAKTMNIEIDTRLIKASDFTDLPAARQEVKEFFMLGNALLAESSQLIPGLNNDRLIIFPYKSSMIEMLTGFARYRKWKNS